MAELNVLRWANSNFSGIFKDHPNIKNLKDLLSHSIEKHGNKSFLSVYDKEKICTNLSLKEVFDKAMSVGDIFAVQSLDNNPHIAPLTENVQISGGKVVPALSNLKSQFDMGELRYNPIGLLTTSNYRLTQLYIMLGCNFMGLTTVIINPDLDKNIIHKIIKETQILTLVGSSNNIQDLAANDVFKETNIKKVVFFNGVSMAEKKQFMHKHELNVLFWDDIMDCTRGRIKTGKRTSFASVAYAVFESMDNNSAGTMFSNHNVISGIVDIVDNFNVVSTPLYQTIQTSSSNPIATNELRLDENEGWVMQPPETALNNTFETQNQYLDVYSIKQGDVYLSNKPFHHFNELILILALLSSGCNVVLSSALPVETTDVYLTSLCEDYYRAKPTILYLNNQDVHDLQRIIFHKVLTSKLKFMSHNLYEYMKGECLAEGDMKSLKKSVFNDTLFHNIVHQVFSKKCRIFLCDHTCDIQALKTLQIAFKTPIVVYFELSQVSGFIFNQYCVPITTTNKFNRINVAIELLKSGNLMEESDLFIRGPAVSSTQFLLDETVPERHISKDSWLKTNHKFVLKPNAIALVSKHSTSENYSLVRSHPLCFKVLNCEDDNIEFMVSEYFYPKFSKLFKNSLTSYFEEAMLKMHKKDIKVTPKIFFNVN